MDAITFIRDYTRMCDSYDYCAECPINDNCLNNDIVNVKMDDLHRIVNTVDEWAKANPIKTCLMDFFEKHPNAPREGGLPIPCAKSLGYVNNCCDYKCKECWNTSLEE